MARYLVTATKSGVVFRKMKKGTRPMAIVNNRLYRVDDKLAWQDDRSNNSIIYYDIDEQQPYGDGSYLDPESTKIHIDSMKLGKGKVSTLTDFSMDKIITVVMIGVIIWAIASQYLG